MKMRALFLVCILLVLTIYGCAEQTPTTAPTTATSTTVPNVDYSMPDEPDWVCPLSVMIDGQIWHDWSWRRLIDPNLIEEGQILGYITSVVPLTTMPTHNDEANYPAALNAPYAHWTDEEFGEVYVIKYGYGWHILLPEGYPIS